jgi:hypothetical protein
MELALGIEKLGGNTQEKTAIVVPNKKSIRSSTQAIHMMINGIIVSS